MSPLSLKDAVAQFLRTTGRPMSPKVNLFGAGNKRKRDDRIRCLQQVNIGHTLVDGGVELNLDLIKDEETETAR